MLFGHAAMMHFGGRLGKKGPKNEELLEDHVNIIRVTDIITLDDLPGLGHDYLLTNDVFQHDVLEEIDENVKSKDKK